MTHTTEPTAAAPKLSELIRRGAAMVDGQCQGQFVVWDNDDVYCCALGAAYYALTGELPPVDSNGECDSTVLNTFSDYPDMGTDSPLVDWVMQRNDAGYRTFEEIAAELEAKGL